MSEEQPGPKNRRERRAAAKESGRPMAAATRTPKLKLAQPDRSQPQGKTLLDVYEDKKSLLDHGQPFDPRHTDGRVRDEGGNILEAGLGDDEPIGPWGEAVFWAVTLAMLHFTLDVLVYNQYRQELEWGEIFGRTFTVVPLLFALVFLLRTETVGKLGVLKQVLYLAVAGVGGCYVIHVTNRYGYYAVMKRAPPLGTLWIWSVIEMDKWFAAGSVAVNLAYLVWNGYTIT